MVLIDKWWNVNSQEAILFRHCSDVLIDTWWNVNDNTHMIISKSGLVLIDTWWNVNKVRAKVFEEGKPF